MKTKFIIKIFLLVALVVPDFSANCQCSFHVPFYKSVNSSDKIILPFDSTKKSKKNNKNGIYFGANLGFYFANKYNAQYYNGSRNNIVYTTIITNTYNYNAIKQVLMSDFKLEELPAKMKYSPSLLIGAFVKYSIKNSGILFQFNISKLSTKDIFTISIKDPLNPDIPIYKQESIFGSEQRANIDLGYSYTFGHNEKSKPYIEFGYNLNDTKFNYNRIKVESLEYSIEDSYASYYKLNQGGIGMGGFIGGGIELVFNESFSLNPGFDFYYIKTKLGYNKDNTTNNYSNFIYNKFKPNYCIFVRAILNGLL